MIQWLKFKYWEWKRGEDVMYITMRVRSHPKARDDGFNRYEAIACVVKVLTERKIILKDKLFAVSKDGKEVIMSIKRKHFNEYLTLSRMVD